MGVGLCVALAALPPVAVRAQGDEPPGLLDRLGSVFGVGAPEGPTGTAESLPSPTSQGAELDADALLGQLEVALGGALDGPAALGEPRGAETGTKTGTKTGAESLKGTYRYRGADGREVFTNVIESVPLAQRAGSELDLSHVSLNSELGTQLNARLEAEHQRLARSDYCVEAKQAAEAEPLQALWDRYSPLIVTGALLLLFVLLTPAMLRRVAVPEWVRTLRFAVPVLAISGMLLYSMMEANRGMHDALSGAAPCQAATFEGLGQGEHPLADRLALVQALRAQTLAADKLPQEITAPDRGL